MQTGSHPSHPHPPNQAEEINHTGDVPRRPGPYHYLACPDCDLINRLHRNACKNQICARCGSVLQRYRPNSIERSLALTIATLVLFIASNSFPFLTMQSGSFIQQTTLFTGIEELWRQNEHTLSLLILFTCIFVPFVQILSLLYILAPLWLFDRRLPGSTVILRVLKHVAPWAMMEVFMIGILVALVKLSHMATIIPGISLVSFGLLIFLMPAALTSLDFTLLWEKLDLRRSS